MLQPKDSFQWMSVFLWPSFVQFNLLLSMVTARIYTPCSFPKPSDNDFNVKCSTDYLYHLYICDPLATFSRTEVDILHENLSKQFVPCSCRDPACRMDQKRREKYRIAIAIVPNGTLNDLLVQPYFHGCSINLETHWNNPDISTIGKITFFGICKTRMAFFWPFR